MKTYTIHETNTELLFVQYPNDGNIFTTGITAKIPIPDGFEFLCLTNDLKEEDLEDILTSAYGCYLNFKTDMIELKSATQSLTSLMEFLELPNQPHVLLTRKI